MMKFVFCLIIGTLFVCRTLRILHSLGYSAQISRIFRVSIAMMVVIFAFWIAKMPDLVFWIVAFLLHLSPGSVLKLIEKHRRRRFRNETTRFFDRLLLGVRSGQSVREVLRKVAMDADFGFHTRDLASASLREDTTLSGTLPPEFRKRVDELRRILAGGYRAGERIHSLRRKYQMRERFQRKSRLATQPVRAQIVIVLVLYICLLALQSWSSPEILVSKWFLTSAFLIGTGLGLIFLLQRGFRWKI